MCATASNTSGMTAALGPQRAFQDIAMSEAKYRSLLWELIAASDEGNYDFLTAEHVQSHARAGGISILLRSTFGTVADFSFLSEDDWANLDVEVAAMVRAEDAPWPFVAKRKGIALLMAFALQGIEQSAQPMPYRWRPILSQPGAMRITS